jgi:hypothetical protein
MNLIKVLFKQRAVLGSGRVVDAGEVAEIPEDHFHPDVHEHTEPATPEPAVPEPLPVEPTSWQEETSGPHTENPES